MLKVFIAFVRLILEYASQVWPPSTVNLINRVDCVRILFTKRIWSVANLPYNEHLYMLDLLRLESRRLYLDVLFLAKLKFNCFHLTLNGFNIRVSNLHNNRFISLPSYSRVSRIISILYVRFVYEIHYITMLLLLEQSMYFVIYYLILILSHICWGILNGLCKAFTLKVFVFFYTYTSK